MKNFFLLGITAVSLLGILLPADVLAQAGSQKKKDNDTLKIKWNNSRIWIFDAEKKPSDSTAKPSPPSKREFIHWTGVDLGISMLTTAANQFHVSESENIYNTNYFLDLKYTRSWYFSLNLFEKGFRLYKNNLMFVTGLGADVSSYNFRNNILLNPKVANTNSSTIQLDTIQANKYIKNQLKAAYIKVPLLLSFNSNNSNPNKSFHLAAGVELGYKVDSWIKQKKEIDGYTYKVKNHADYNLSNFKYGLEVRAGYGFLTVFANYSYSPLFDKDKGPEKEVFPLTVGISIIDF